MIGWRIARQVYADLSGAGGLYASGRWHNRGQPILYTADHPALALLEVRVHLDLPPDLLPDDYVLMKLYWPDELDLCDICDEARQVFHDEKDGSDEELRDMGDKWLKDQKTLVAQVPSVLVPHCNNYLLNPAHTDRQNLELLSTEPVSFDQRLFGQT